MKQPVPVRSEFRDWVDKHPDPGWETLPLTHIAKGITARDIISSGRLEPSRCDVLDAELIYCFYGRPAYRVGGDGAVKQEALCPYCFIFSPDLIKRAREIHAFDTGAHGKRLFSHILADEFSVSDFSLGRESKRADRLIGATFGSRSAYFDGDVSEVGDPESISAPWEFQTRAYLSLITSPGRNEPDDRVYSIEVNFADPISLEGALLAVVVPHTMWGAKENAPWLEGLAQTGVQICTYPYFPGRGAEYYQAQLEFTVRDYYKERGVL
jgi:hypothetical protein